MYSQPVPYLFSQHHPLLVLQEQDLTYRASGEKTCPVLQKVSNRVRNHSLVLCK